MADIEMRARRSVEPAAGLCPAGRLIAGTVALMTTAAVLTATTRPVLAATLHTGRDARQEGPTRKEAGHDARAAGSRRQDATGAAQAQAAPRPQSRSSAGPFAAARSPHPAAPSVTAAPATAPPQSAAAGGGTSDRTDSDSSCGGPDHDIRGAGEANKDRDREQGGADPDRGLEKGEDNDCASPVAVGGAAAIMTGGVQAAVSGPRGIPVPFTGAARHTSNGAEAIVLVTAGAALVAAGRRRVRGGLR